MATTGKITIYAELLPNIRQVSVVASLPSACSSATTRAVLLDGGGRIHVTHRDDTAVLDLPAKVLTPDGSPILAIPQQRAGDSSQCSWRLPLQQGAGPTTARSNGSGLASAASSNDVPWEAVRMAPGCAVLCRSCKTGGAGDGDASAATSGIIVPAGRVEQWKDLPSENWAEMMEFWHCHKPDDHSDHDHDHGAQHQHQLPAEGDDGKKGKADERSLTARGYGANSTISAQRGVCFVDLMAFLLAEEDCEGITFSPSSFDDGSQSRASCAALAPGARSLNVFCTACRAKLGYYSFRSSAVTLFKWQILCDQQRGLTTPPSMAQCLAATLLASVARSGSSKSLIIPLKLGLADRRPTAIATSTNGSVTPTADASSKGEALHVWILNGHIRFASTGVTHTGSSIAAIKLLFRVITSAEADTMLEQMNSDAQDISLPEESLRSVMDLLRESNKLLPASDRSFQGWTVGLVDKWEMPDVLES